MHWNYSWKEQMCFLVFVSKKIKYYTIVLVLRITDGKSF